MFRAPMQACRRLVATRPIFPSSSHPFSLSSSLLHEKESDKKSEAAACGRSKADEMMRKKTPIGKLEEQPNVHPAQEKVEKE